MDMQDKVLKDIVGVIEGCGLEALMCPAYANTGRISLQQKNEIGEYGYVSYNFQSSWGTMTFSISIGGKKVLSQPPRLNYHDFYMKYSEINNYKNFRKVLTSSATELALSLASTTTS